MNDDCRLAKLYELYIEAYLPRGARLGIASFIKDIVSFDLNA